MGERKNWTDSLREEKKGRVRHGSLGNIELWKKKREESEGEDCFNKSKKTVRTPEKDKLEGGKMKCERGM